MSGCIGQPIFAVEPSLAKLVQNTCCTDANCRSVTPKPARYLRSMNLPQSALSRPHFGQPYDWGRSGKLEGDHVSHVARRYTAAACHRDCLDFGSHSVW